MNDLPIDKLGQWPVLQFAAVILIVAGLALAVYRGARDRRTPDARATEHRYFFDGPIGEGLKLLRDQRNLLNETRDHVEPLGELMRNMNRELAEINRKVDDLKAIKSRGR